MIFCEGGRARSAVLVVAAVWFFACDKNDGVESKPADLPAGERVEASPAPSGESSSDRHRAQGTVGEATVMMSAQIGQPAPDFSLADLDGKQVSLSAFRGKTVVLEWFNPQCPFVKAAHTRGSLIDAEKKARQEGVVWLYINSGAPGRQGHGALANRQGVEAFELQGPVLLDESGAVGRSYGATNTPHLYVINGEGLLVYRGAVDNSPDGEGASPTGDTLVNYVQQALVELKAGKALSVAETRAYGCSVKYAP